MNKVKYIVSGITIGRLEHIISQLKNTSNEGIVVLAEELPKEILEIDAAGQTRNISFGEFVNKVINEPLQNPERSKSKEFE